MQQPTPVSVAQLEEMEHTNSIAHGVLLCGTEITTEQGQFPEIIQKVLDQFQVVFEEPAGLPQRKPWDHAIPLLEGTEPVNI